MQAAMGQNIKRKEIKQMGYSHSTLVERFKQGKTKGSASHMYISGDTLYSYGSHSPLLVRVPFGYLMNADKRSSSTSGHQRHCMGLATLQVPFSVLSVARIPHYSGEEQCFRVIDKKDEVWEIIGAQKNAVECADCEHKEKPWGERPQGCQAWGTDNGCGKKVDSFKCGLIYRRQRDLCKKVKISAQKYNEMSEDEKLGWQELTERRPSGAVIEWNGKYYLSSMDTESRHPDYFLVELPHAVETVDEAFESLIPAQVKDKKYRRQGEWFFVEDNDIEKPRVTYREMEQEFSLPMSNDSSNPHIATRGCRTNDGGVLVSGGIHHREHGLMQLSKSDNPKIFNAYINTAVNSWSAGGRVD